MENTLLEMTDFGSEGIVVKQGNVQFVVIPVFELEGENGEYLLDSDVMNQEFQYKMDYLKSQYPKNEDVDILKDKDDEYTLEQFAVALLDWGVPMKDIEEKQQFIRDWYEETHDMNLEELVDDFLFHFNYIEPDNQ